jgi:Type VI secretion system (T6SS), amidase effector protein 4
MLSVNFQSVWKSHPLNWSPKVKEPCIDSDGKPAYLSQCAIRLSIALQRGGVNLNACKKLNCGLGHSEKHFIRAQELASWFSGGTVLGKPQTFPKKRGDRLTEQQTKQFFNHRGIVFFQNFYNPVAPADSPDTPPFTGDHIDLWNTDSLSGVNAVDWNWNYFYRAENIWFWEIKS